MVLTARPDSRARKRRAVSRFEHSCFELELLHETGEFTAPNQWRGRRSRLGLPSGCLPGRHTRWGDQPWTGEKSCSTTDSARRNCGMFLLPQLHFRSRILHRTNWLNLCLNSAAQLGRLLSANVAEIGRTFICFYHAAFRHVARQQTLHQQIKAFHRVCALLIEEL